MTVKAIETRYAGCRFRSRLEARWAVFFDTLGIPWEYEPQGFELTHERLFYRDEAFRYLPDFWLPSLGLWVEVKGDDSTLDLERLASAAAEDGLPNGPDGSEWPDRNGARILILGPIPEPGPTPTHFVLGFHKGDIEVTELTFADGGTWIRFNGTTTFVGYCIANDAGDVYTPRQPLTSVRRGCRSLPYLDHAYRAARSARFEYGESG